MHKYNFIISAILLLSCLAPCVVIAADTGTQQSLSIGLISSKPQKRINQTTPLVDYMVSRLPEYSQGKIYVNESISHMAGMLKTGAVKMVVTTAYAGLLIEKKSQAEIAAIRWKQGVDNYHSVIFSRKDSAIKTIQDLNGHTIVFERDSSTSAFFIPSIFLLNQGLNLQRLHSTQEQPDADKVGYLFLSDLMRKPNEVNMSIGVFRKRFDAAAFSHIDWDDSGTTPAKAKQALQVIAKTPAYPRAVVLLSPVLNTQQKRDILQVLFNAEKSEQGIKAMARFKKTTRFSALSPEIRAQLQKAQKQLAKHPELYK